MEGVGNAAGYNARANATQTVGSASILRRAVDGAKSGASAGEEIAFDGVLDVTGDNAAAEAAAASRPIGNLGHHLDLRL